jgi:DNA-binding CsgD family transcriptional regulator
VKKTAKNRSAEHVTLGRVSAPLQLTPRRERRLLKLVQAGVTVAEASRAVAISRQTVWRHARADAVFAVQLQAARAGSRWSAGQPLDDWREAALMLERTDPVRWALPGGDDDPFRDFDPGA